MTFTYPLEKYMELLQAYYGPEAGEALADPARNRLQYFIPERREEINYRIYVREYPGQGGRFIKVFTLVSWAFFIIVVIPGYLLSRWRFF